MVIKEAEIRGHGLGIWIKWSLVAEGHQKIKKTRGQEVVKASGKVPDHQRSI